MATNLKFYKKATAPTSATQGSIWFDTSETSLKLFTGGSWIPFGVTKESFLQWGGKNFRDSFGPIDAAMIPELGANRFAFLKSGGINIEASRDGGETWNTYTSTTNYTCLFGRLSENSYYIGDRNTTNIDKSKDQLRVTITTNLANIYSKLNKFAIFLTTSGSQNCWCTIRARTKSNADTNTDSWVTFADKVPVSGWSGWNIINTSDITTYGNSQSQYQNIQFIFGCESSPETNNYTGLNVQNILAFGGVGWETPSNMAKNGHLYTYDSKQNATFPAAITSASGFKLANSSNDYVLLGYGGSKKITDLSVASAKTATSAAGLTWVEYND